MKKVHYIAMIVALAGLAVSPAAFAKKNKGTPAQTVPSDVYSKYDINSNGKLDTNEVATIRADFARDPNDTLLKPYDTNTDSKLSDDEIAAIPSTKTADAPVKKKKHKTT